MLKVWQRSYISSGEEEMILAHFFSLDKSKDTKMVYNDTSSGINDVLWDPHFTLPTIYIQMRDIKPGSIMVYIDIGEMFINFILHQSLWRFCMVDVTHMLYQVSLEVFIRLTQS